MRLPKTIAVTVESDTLGTIAVSVPVEWSAPERGSENAYASARWDPRELDAAIEERESRPSPQMIRRGPGSIDAAPLRDAAIEAVVQGEETWSALAFRAGYTREKGGNVAADIRRFKRDLGVTPSDPHKTLTASTARRLAAGLNLDPVDLGF